MQGNEVESVNTPTVRSWEVYFYAILFDSQASVK